MQVCQEGSAKRGHLEIRTAKSTRKLKEDTNTDVQVESATRISLHHAMRQCQARGAGTAFARRIVPERPIERWDLQ
jgi:hypothetical protein